MKNWLPLIFVFSVFSVFGQKTCCSVTDDFAQLASAEGFSASHQLPKTSEEHDELGEWINFETPDEKSGRAYVVAAKSPTNKFLFVFHEWWGLNENILREAEKWGASLPDVTIIALDLYDGKIGTTREAAGELMQAANEERIRNIIQGAIDWVGPKAEVATLGWCFGGGWSMQSALQLESQAIGCVIFYGMPEKDPDRLVDLNCKVLGIFAEKDKWINREVVGQYERAMNKAEKPYETFWFNAEHAFANPSNPVFNETAANRANQKTLDYLRKVFE